MKRILAAVPVLLVLANCEAFYALSTTPEVVSAQNAGAIEAVSPADPLLVRNDGSDPLIVTGDVAENGSAEAGRGADIPLAQAADGDEEPEAAGPDTGGDRTVEAVAEAADEAVVAKGDGEPAGGAGEPTSENAERILEELLERKQRMEESKKVMADSLIRTGLEKVRNQDLLGAAKDFESALRHDPQNETARREHNRVSLMLNKREMEVKSAVDLLAERQQVAETLRKFRVEHDFTLALSFMDKEEYERAIQLFRGVLDSIKAQSDGSREMALIERRAADKLKEAEALKIQQAKAGALREVQRAARKAKELQEIENTIQSEQVRALLTQANLHLSRKEYPKAIEFFDAILLMDPTNGQVAARKHDALNSYHVQKMSNLQRTKREELRNLWMRLDEAAVPMYEYMIFPDNWETIDRIRKAEELFSEEDTEETEKQRQYNSLLDTEKITTPFEKVPVAEAFGYLQQTKGIPFFVDLGSEFEEATVTLRVQNLNLRSVINLICDQTKVDQDTRLTYRVEDDGVFIQPLSKIRTSRPIRIYDLSDLVGEIKHYSAPKKSLNSQAGDGGGGLMAGDDEQVEVVDAEGYTEVLRQIVKPMHGDWGDQDIMNTQSNKLIVTSDPQTHKKIASILDGFRQSHALQVAIQFRSVEVQDYFLEDIGIDFTGLQDVQNDPNVGGVRGGSGAQLYPLQAGMPGVTQELMTGFAARPEIVPYTLHFNPWTEPFSKPGQYEDTWVPVAYDHGTGTLSYRPTTEVPFVDQRWPAEIQNMVTQNSQIIGKVRLRDLIQPNTGFSLKRGGTYHDINTNQLTGTVDPRSPLALESGGITNRTHGLRLQFAWLDHYQTAMLLRAVRASVKGTIVSSPMITLYNTRRSFIFVGTQVGYIKETDVSVESSDPMQVQRDLIGNVVWEPQIGYWFYGTSFEVQPTVSADKRYIQLDLQPDICDPIVFRNPNDENPGIINNATLSIELPQQVIIKIRCTVSVPDGGTLLMGGLAQYYEREMITGVPVLSKIPFIKHFFQHKGFGVERANRLFLVKATIIMPEEYKHVRRDSITLE